MTAAMAPPRAVAPMAAADAADAMCPAPVTAAVGT